MSQGELTQASPGIMPADAKLMVSSNPLEIDKLTVERGIAKIDLLPFLRLQDQAHVACSRAGPDNSSMIVPSVNGTPV